MFRQRKREGEERKRDRQTYTGWKTNRLTNRKWRRERRHGKEKDGIERERDR